MLPDHHKDHPSKIEAHADSQHAGEEEDGAGHILGPRAEAHGQELVDTLDAVFVVGPDEGEGDHHAGDHRSDGELPVEQGSRLVSLGGRAKEGGCACFRGNDRGKDRPPRDGSASEGKFLQRRVAPARPQTDPDDAGEVSEDDRRINPESPVGEGRHGSALRRTSAGVPSRGSSSSFRLPRSGRDVPRGAWRCRPR